ncbi:hypothetical protein DP939_03990 [Spongiactinospora rosea]|uniref:Maleylpyruvate isomerase family mycothiol-dependent enzyme n=1 Tax=Spongiactinospora rosea TaxID=2248750 RepID=A0A366M726_9ACTN|nr:maleylpyruvate isomerase family mycothiol-dependent enzyme [Spongiactinospora rosea]RBQ21847.1 hypothetical protein DP939_03990 [Spongiactinospora rosea]
MDLVPHFRREIQGFEAAVRGVAGGNEAPLTPSCPGWSVNDLIAHLGGVHRGVSHIIKNDLVTWPGMDDLGFLRLPAEAAGWPRPDTAPNRGPVPAGLIDWFAEGAAELYAVFRDTDPAQRAWTWSREQTVGFWVRVQAIEAAVHRWDAQAATGDPEPIDADLASDMIAQTFEVMAPARREWRQAPPGRGERYAFRRTDGPGAWTARFDGGEVALTDGPGDVELAGTASDLALYLWGRVPADRLQISGDKDVLDRYFTLVPPV